MDGSTSNPLILTLQLEDSVQAYFNQLRKAYFPAERNYLDAHLTMFHHLPAHEKQIVTDIEYTTSQNAEFRLTASAVVGIGNGVAFKIVSEELAQMHRLLQQQWHEWLIPQDRQKLWPHITVQNKVSPEVAKNLKEQLEENFQPFEFKATGLSLWEYLGRPWKSIRNYQFQK
ncbi:2'-5' RNA ligase family protein [Mucilaginibacter sp. RS28]|uniref:2'-5' RNA ligase family protein n=1 Tax=Mucilaginibacter straminoryzae TaxID=2932774 RepID=A0A9X1X3W7_9SPHI|nr:2'-5' RNA ligase family protein [Mucilaginibacter straminoryzae]MCJ8209680.1 2'-5' RNA ligase family protein [Mucilaginibacter straminoryzae]